MVDATLKALTGRMTFELAVYLFARAAIGVLSAIALSFLFWWATWASFSTSHLGQELFFLIQAAIIGLASAIPTTFAWWNTQSSRKLNLASFFLILLMAVACAWLYNNIRGVETYHALIGGVQRIPVFSLSHMLIGMIFGAAIGGNVMGACLYFYRALRYREF